MAALGRRSEDLTEAELQAQILELAAWSGWRSYHTHDSRRSNPGFPDLILVRRRRLVAAELKSRRGRLEPAQREWLEALAFAGVETYLWRPKDWPVITEILTRADWSSSREEDA